MSPPRVGIVGAGQLGRMMALAAYPLGIQCRFLDPNELAPAGQLAPVRVGLLDDERELKALAAEVDVLTLEIENVSVAALESLEGTIAVRPTPVIVAKAQDRLLEKRLFESLDIPTAAYVPIDNPDDLDRAGETLGWPLVLKTRRLGYDGRGQRVAQSPAELEAAWTELGSAPAIAEAWVDFERELSLIGVRGQDDDLAFYSLSENRHRDGMLETSIAPYADAELERQARSWMTAMLRQHDYVGVLTIEFFHTGTGLVANEIAPRVHNSGHWTIEGAETSQFENHIRAVIGLPLGSTAPRGTSVMRNLIGRVPDKAKLLKINGLHLHDYGKEPRPKRKVGHCTILAGDRQAAIAKLEELETALRGS
ncbi:MAG TPA: 5-(carboxyamino)imidazole ribonucleotide synthase [Gammaproteobacteria bacterium]